MLLFYNVSSTGIPNFKLPSEDPSQPHVVQICAVLCSTEGRTLASINLPIEPDGWELPTDVPLLGLNTELAKRAGVPLRGALAIFWEMAMKATVRVAHAEDFHARMIRIGYHQVALPDKCDLPEWKNQASFDTCREATKLVGLPPTDAMLARGRHDYKPPSLVEAYEHFTRRRFRELEEGRPSAIVVACKAVFFAIEKAKKGEPVAQD